MIIYCYKFTSVDKICNIDDLKEERNPRISITALSKVLPLRELRTQKTRIHFLISSLTTYIRKAILRAFSFTISVPGRISALHFLNNNGSW